MHGYCWTHGWKVREGHTSNTGLCRSPSHKVEVDMDDTLGLHVLDNEASEKYRNTITENGVTYQLVPSHVRQRNASEKAIHTFEVHLKQYSLALTLCSQGTVGINYCCRQKLH